MVSARCLVLAAALFLLSGQRLKAKADYSVTDVQACYNRCDALYDNITVQALDLKQYYNSTTSMADAYCRYVLNVSDCYNACKERYPAFTYASAQQRSAPGAFADCFTDEGNCRLYDGKLCSASYQYLYCGTNLKEYEKCVIDAQQSRGCNMTTIKYKSQRIIKQHLLNTHVYCTLQTEDVYKKQLTLNQLAADALQQCTIYVPSKCLSFIRTAGSGGYIDVEMNCTAIKATEACLYSTLNTTIMENEFSFAQMCSHLPNSPKEIQDLAAQVRNVYGPAACLGDVTSGSGSSGAAAVAPADVSACYKRCDTLYDNVPAQSSLMTDYRNSTTAAANVYCRYISNVSDCYKSCKERYPAFTYTSAQQRSASGIFADCFTDEGNCRLYDGKLCSAFYQYFFCGTNLQEYEKCVIDAQQSRGCNMTTIKYKSQRMIKQHLLDSHVYCALQTEDVYNKQLTLDQVAADALQQCTIYVPSTCLSYISAAGSSGYIDGEMNCSAIKAIEACLYSTFNTTITNSGFNFTQMCSYLPNSPKEIQDLAAQVNNAYGPAACRGSMPSGSGSSGAAAVAPADVSACYKGCDTLYDNVPAQSSLMAQYRNSTTSAANAYCRYISNVSDCYNSCKVIYPAFTYYSTQQQSVPRILADCFTDEANCRLYDGKLCSTFNQYLLCGIHLEVYEKCVIDAQLSRGCNMTAIKYKSQRMVKKHLLESHVFCTLQTDSVYNKLLTLEPVLADALQQCTIYVPNKCLSYVSATGPNGYIDGDVNCTATKAAETCIYSTLNTTVIDNGLNFTQMCSYLPSSPAEIQDLAEQVRNVFGPAACSGVVSKGSGSEGAAAQSNTTAQDCNTRCDQLYTSLYRSAVSSSALASFLLSKGNSTKRAADEVCSNLSSVMTCYSSCDKLYSASLSSSTSSTQKADALNLNGRFCFVASESSEGSNCRLMDSYYCEGRYNQRKCGSYLDMYKECVVSTQQANNCFLDKVVSQGQRNVQWWIMEAVSYCALNSPQVVEKYNYLGATVSSAAANRLLACATIVNSMCFADFLTNGQSAADKYIRGLLPCSSYAKAERCILNTLNSTFLYRGNNVSSPCIDLPGSLDSLKSIVTQLRNLTPNACSNIDSGSSAASSVSATVAAQTPQYNTTRTFTIAGSASSAPELPSGLTFIWLCFYVSITR